MNNDTNKNWTVTYPEMFARIRYSHEQALSAYYATRNLYFMELARAAY